MIILYIIAMFLFLLPFGVWSFYNFASQADKKFEHKWRYILLTWLFSWMLMVVDMVLILVVAGVI